MLDGLPNLLDLGKLKIGEDVPEMFSADLGLEMTNQSCLKDAIPVCEENRDFVTRELFNKILDDETSNKMPLDIIEEAKKTFNERIQRINWETYYNDLPFNPSALSIATLFVSLVAIWFDFNILIS